MRLLKAPEPRDPLPPVQQAVADLLAAANALADLSEPVPLAAYAVDEPWDDAKLKAEVQLLEQRAVIRLGQMMRENRGTKFEASTISAIGVMGAKVRQGRYVPKQSGEIGRARPSVQDSLAAQVSELAAGEDPDAEPADG